MGSDTGYICLTVIGFAALALGFAMGHYEGYQRANNERDKQQEN